MKERPILFSAPMVRAILAGTKTQTRRVVKPQPEVREIAQVGRMLGFRKHKAAGFWLWPNARERILAECPYGKPRDRLWVRENFRIGEDLGAGWEPWMSIGDRFVAYDMPADDDYCVPEDYVIPRNAREVHNSAGTDEHWRSFGPIPSIHMPRWASRITLEITGVHIERLQGIREVDAIAEGIERVDELHGNPLWRLYGKEPWNTVSPIESYLSLWESINGPGSWDANPWVWIIEFKRVLPVCLE